MTRPPDCRPLIAHLIYRFDVGGLENGLVNLINGLPRDRYRHAVLCLRGASDFSRRLNNPAVTLFDVGQTHGHSPGWYLRLWRLLRILQPTVFHSRNLPTLEGQLVAAAARVPLRVHGEHGRDIYDLYGNVPRYRLLRRVVDRVVHRYVAVSADLRNWLVEDIGVAASKTLLIRNGVDLAEFRPGVIDRRGWPPGFCADTHVVIGTVGRLATVKDQSTLAKAFCVLIKRSPQWRQHVRLVIVGDGPLRDECLRILRTAQAEELAWLAGNRNDVAALMRGFNVFVLPSLAEGMSNTVLEAMATSLPVVATAVGGNNELVEDSVTGRLVPSGDENALADALHFYVTRQDERTRHGHNGLRRIEAEFRIQKMVSAYQDMYETLISSTERRHKRIARVGPAWTRVRR